MSYRFLILNTDYHEFLYQLYGQHPGLENQSYEEQMRVRVESLFGVADFYSGNLRNWDMKRMTSTPRQAWTTLSSSKVSSILFLRSPSDGPSGIPGSSIKRALWVSP